MYFIVGILGAISLYSYYDVIKKTSVEILIKSMGVENSKGSFAENEEKQKEEYIKILRKKYNYSDFQVIPSETINEITEIVHKNKDDDEEYCYLTCDNNEITWPPKHDNNKEYLTIYSGDKNIESVFRKYAGPKKNFYDGNIYVKFILSNTEEVEVEEDIVIMDNMGKIHKISRNEICYKFT